MTYEATYKEQIQNEWDKYIASIEAIARCEFEFEIRPWIDKYHLEFHSGMGGWWIYATEETPDWFVNRHKDTYYQKKFYLDNDKLPEKIRNILNQEIHGLPANNLGSMLRDYPSSE